MDKTKKEKDFVDESAMMKEMDSFFEKDIEQEMEDVLVDQGIDQGVTGEVVTSSKFYQRYGSNARLLTKEEEVACGMAVKYGSADEAKGAKQKLIEHNLRYVLSIAGKYAPNELNYDDLVQEGCIGLMKAAEKFDPELGYRFTTYATWWIKQSIQRAIMDRGRTIRIPVHLMEKIQVLRKAEREAERISDRETMEVLIEKTGFTRQQIIQLQTWSQTIVSLDMPSGEDQETTMGDMVAAETQTPEDVIMQQCLSEDLRAVMASCLNKKEFDIIVKRFGLDGDRPRTLEECGKMYGVTRERIRQIEANALRKLKNPKRAKKLRNYVSDTA